jgi:hypothetical protein
MGHQGAEAQRIEMDKDRRLKLVPFNNAWVQHDKLDLKAIYKRPRYTVNAYDETVLETDDKTGEPKYDLTGALPVRHHNKYAAKGFVYVTLADRESLKAAGEHGTIQGNWREYDQHQTGGPWNYKLYQLGQEEAADVAFAELEEQVKQFGSAAVLQIRRTVDPKFELPKKLRSVKAPKETTPA